MDLNKRQCIYCGKEFKPKTPLNKFCSAECRINSKKNEKIKKTCVICGKEFETYNSTRLYCSNNCRYKARWERIKNR